MSLLLSRFERAVTQIPEITTTVIVCGDCDDPQSEGPVRTLLTTGRRCHRCGGRSYVLAAVLAEAVRHTDLLKQLEEKDTEIERLWRVSLGQLSTIRDLRAQLRRALEHSTIVSITQGGIDECIINKTRANTDRSVLC